MPLPHLLIEAVARLGYRVADRPSDRGGRELVATSAAGTVPLVEPYDPAEYEARTRAAFRLARTAGVDLEDG